MRVLFDEMFTLQHYLNEKVNKDWKNQGYNIPLAIMQEASELVDSVPWKWWKYSDNKGYINLPMSSDKIDIENCKLEVVDIWHFLMSDIIVTSGERGVETATQYAVNILPHLPKIVNPNIGEFSYRVKHFVVSVLTNTDSTCKIERFDKLIQCVMLDWYSLYKLYIAKNALNELRYSTDNYKKIWDGEEDNRYLFSIPDDITDREDIYNWLKDTYKKING